VATAQCWGLWRKRNNKIQGRASSLISDLLSQFFDILFWTGLSSSDTVNRVRALMGASSRTTPTINSNTSKDDKGASQDNGTEDECPIRPPADWHPPLVGGYLLFSSFVLLEVILYFVLLKVPLPLSLLLFLYMYYCFVKLSLMECREFSPPFQLDEFRCLVISVALHMSASYE